MSITHYLSREELGQFIDEATLQRHTDDANTGQIDEGIVGKILSDATGFIDAYLRQRYTLPLLASCDELKNCAAEFVRYKIYMRRPDGEDLPKAVVREFDNTKKFLADVRDGKLALTVIDSATAEVSSPRASSKIAVRTSCRREKDMLMKHYDAFGECD